MKNREIVNLFFELIQVSLENRDLTSRIPSVNEWAGLLDLAYMHSIAGVMLDGVEKTVKSYGCTTNDVILEWIGEQLITQKQNEVQERRTKELFELFCKAGFRSCVLKGQGTATYYPHPEDRECGDIDLWVEGDRDKILAFVRSQGYTVNSVDLKHSDIEVFKDVPVEVHFRPSWMYNPFTDRKLQRFFKEKADSQFQNADEQAGYVHTTIDFDLVFSMVHIYRHIFSEGVGLRQLMDYYFILRSSTEEQRKEAFCMLKQLGMCGFVGGVMWILRDCFAMDRTWMLCPVNERHGKFLFREIMASGNFGQYDQRMTHLDKNLRFRRGFIQLKRNFRFLTYYPSEVLWSPVWKIWHYCWRKQKGYL